MKSIGLLTVLWGGAYAARGGILLVAAAATTGRHLEANPIASSRILRRDSPQANPKGIVPDALTVPCGRFTMPGGDGVRQ